MKLQVLYSFIKDELSKIESDLHSIVESESTVIEEASTSLVNSGGKRVRPVFVLLSSKFGNSDAPLARDVAVSLELIHMASLVHDDVIDGATKRRGNITINEQYNNRVSMYTGDFLFARALEKMSNLQETRAHLVLSNTMVELCIGEFQQLHDKYNFNQNLRSYLRRIKRKTALLLASSCQLGAIAGNASKEWERRLYLYGYYVGMSYQIIDDILDFVSTEEELGKPAGSDLLQGHVTLPVLYELQKGELTDQIIKVNEHMTKEEFQPLLESIRKSDAIKLSRELSSRYLEKALKAIEPLPKGKPKSTLIAIANNMGKRKF